MDDNRLGAMLKMLRKKKKCSQQEIADSIGVVRQTYSHYETGRIMPPHGMLVRLAECYGVAPAVLCGLAGETDAPATDFMELSQQEWQLVDTYRSMDGRDREELLAIARIKAERNKWA